MLNLTLEIAFHSTNADSRSVAFGLTVRLERTLSPTGRTKLQIKGQFFAYIMRNIDRREREVSNEGMKLLLESSENTAFQATFWG